ncbi:MAG TPA: DUF2203 domain-containing protein [Gemmatimonadota bacterium]|jgi:hypothetical protein
MSTLGQELRLFTLEEAQSMLPLVKSIVRGILEDYAILQPKAAELRELERDATAPEARARRKTLFQEVEELTARVNEALAELDTLGVEFKGYEQGLVDFPARRYDEIVYLCWKYDEERIGCWHSLEGGFTGRRPLDEGIE